MILLNGWILSVGGASAVKGLGLQPVRQACFLMSVHLFIPISKKKSLPIFVGDFVSILPQNARGNPRARRPEARCTDPGGEVHIVENRNKCSEYIE